MVIGRTLKKYFPNESRRIILFDTFLGMTPPGKIDISRSGVPAETLLQTAVKIEGRANVWAYASKSTVIKNLEKFCGSLIDNFVLVEGDVKFTLPKTEVLDISLLRLDTDWY